MFVVNSITDFFRKTFKNSDTKHDQSWKSYGYPECLGFSNYYWMYRRNGFAARLIDAKPDVCWQQSPEVYSGDSFEDYQDRAEQTDFESDFIKIAKRLKLWRTMRIADKYQRINKYSAIVVQIKGTENQAKYAEPLGNITDKNIAKLRVFYDEHCTPVEWEQDPSSIRFGLPLYYQVEFNDPMSDDQSDSGARTSELIHWTRVITFAEGAPETDSLEGLPILEKPFNRLVDVSKILGAYGEGSWFNSSAKTVYHDKTEGEGVDGDSDEYKNLNKNIKNFRKAEDSALLAGYFEPKILNTKLDDPKNTLEVALAEIGASDGVPSKILMGTQTGRLAGDADETGFLQSCQSRCESTGNDFLESVIDWFIEHGVLADEEYGIQWSDLLASSDKDKIDIIEKMANTNQKNAMNGEVFSSEDMRQYFYGEKVDEDADDEPEPSDLTPEGE